MISTLKKSIKPKDREDRGPNRKKLKWRKREIYKLEMQGVGDYVEIGKKRMFDLLKLRYREY